MSKPATGKTGSTKKTSSGTGSKKEALPPIQPRKVIVSGPSKQVFIIDDASELDDINTIQCVSLLHPKHSKPARFLHSSKSIWEIQRVYQPPSSWIMQHSIQEDGSFYICTKIDPLFLALPLLERGRKKTADHEGYFLQLDQLLPKSEFPLSYMKDGKPVGDNPIHTICDLRDGWDAPVCRLSDTKVVEWLRAKVERMRHAFKKVPGLSHHYTRVERDETPEQEKLRLEEQRIKQEEEQKQKSAADDSDEKKESSPMDTSDGAAAGSSSTASSSPVAAASPSTPSASPSAASVASYCATAAHASSSLKQSLLFLSEYLPTSFFTFLLSSYSLKPEDVFEKKRAVRKEWDVGGGGGGKVSGDIDTSRPAGGGAPITSENKRKAEKPISSAAKKLATAAKGTKSLASFFGKKA